MYQFLGRPPARQSRPDEIAVSITKWHLQKSIVYILVPDAGFVKRLWRN